VLIQPSPEISRNLRAVMPVADRVVLAIDPSIGSMGYAVLNQRQTWIRSGCWHPSKRVGADSRWQQLVDFVAFKLDEHKVTDLVVERPGIGQRFDRGKARSINNLMPYAIAIGHIEAVGRMKAIRVYSPTVNQWKSWSTKGTIEAYVFHATGVTCSTTDEAEAIGIGLWFVRKGALELQEVIAK
jgi:Holliday junction resolvasome RuvABC endonuclease subunit